MVLPLTIFLTAIMTFGNFGERYELGSNKSAGMSLWRIMRPLLLLNYLVGFNTFSILSVLFQIFKV